MAYCSISVVKSHIHITPTPLSIKLPSYTTPTPFSILSFPFNPPPRFCALKSGCTNHDSYGSELLRKPVTIPVSDDDSTRDFNEEEEWVDWEDRILEDTVPLVGFVRMILHSGKYESGDRLSPEHERTILDRLLPHHPECDKKIGSGVDYITVGYHPDFESSRCLFIVQKDGQMVDFSYWKCLKGLIRKNYPLYADSFILRHFRQRRRSD